MSGSIVVVVPPSEAKEPGGSRSAQCGRFDAPLGEARREVVAALATLLDTASPTTLEATLKVRAALLERALESSRAIVANHELLMPAWQRYRGVVWTHLDPATLDATQRQRILVPSGLYGITTGEDYVADYRLKMSATLSPLGGLAAFWRPLLTPVLAEHLRGATVVNLLPREHAAALDDAALRGSCEIMSISFVTHDGAGAAGHAAKAVKGVMARQLLLGGLDALDSFRWKGWRARRRAGTTWVVAPCSRHAKR